MIDFEFYSPTKIYFGHNKEEEIGAILKKFGYKKILFHYGMNSIKQIGLYEKVVKSLQEYKIDFVELSGVEPNPKIGLVRIGVEMAKENQVDMILAVGGGSVIDSAKAIACGALVDFDPWLFNSHEKKPINALPIGVILTISAAGSELSNSCVITNDELKIKNGFNDDLVRPKFVIMNPELTFSVSKFQTACGVVDILMHTLERYFTNTPNTEFSKNISEGLLKSVIASGKIAFENPTDYEARATLMIASSFSHNGLTGLGSKIYFTVHKIEHEMSGMFDRITHGAGLSVLFIAWAKWIYQKDLTNWVRFATNVMNVNPLNKTKEEVARCGIEELEKYFVSLEMPVTLDQLNITLEDASIMTDRLIDRFGKVPGYVMLDKEALLEIFNLATK